MSTNYTMVKKEDKPDKYKEVAEEILKAIGDHIFDSSRQPLGVIEDVLRRNFDINKEGAGRLLLSDTIMFNIYDGETFTVPLFGVLAFTHYNVRIVIPNCVYLNYNIRNKYMGYTIKGIFHKVGWTAMFMDVIKKDPQLIAACIIVGVSVSYLLLSF